MRSSRVRRSPLALGAGALALGALLSTYVGAIRPPAAYARHGKSNELILIGASAVPAGCAANATIVDDTVSLSAALAVGDDTVLCIVDSFTLDDTIVLDDTSLTLMGPDDTAVVLTSRSDARHIVATSSPGSDDTLAIYNITLAGQATLGSGGIEFLGDNGFLNFDRVVIDDSAAIVDGYFGYAGALRAEAHVHIGDAYVARNKGGYAGAVLIVGPATIDGARFVENATVYTGIGGAIFQGNGTMSISDSLFQSNNAVAGGAITHISRLVISESRFIDNSAQEVGGAIYSRFNGAPPTSNALVISSATFARNSADDTGGAIFIDPQGNYGLLSVAGSWFDDNYAMASGGIHAVDGSVTLQNVAFTGNDAVSTGAAVGSQSAALSLESVSFTRNGDDTSASFGGALYGPADASTYMVNVTAVQNVARTAGGFAYLRGGTLANPDDVIFSTIAGNIAGNGGGIKAGGDTHVSNSVVYANDSGAAYQDVDLTVGSTLSHSLFSDATAVLPASIRSGTGVLFATNAGLGPLADNGGARAGASADDTYLSTNLPQTGSPLIGAATAASGQAVFDAVGTPRSTTGPNAIGAVQVAAPTPPVPPAPIPASPPRDVSATAGDREVTVTWQAPISSGSFPVSQYQMQASPGGGSCLVTAPELTCVITGVTNGVEYTVRGRALTGAGWSAFSAASDPVTPSAQQTIVIAGSREGREVRVDGVTTGLVGSRVTPWVRFPGPHAYGPGVDVRTVDAQGEFTWQRMTGKKTYVYFRADDGVRSNRVVIAAR